MKAGVWLGERSYGLYLWHFPVTLVVLDMGTMTRAPSLSWVGLRILVIVVVSVGLGAMSYRFVEKPGRELGRRLGHRARTRYKVSATVPDPTTVLP
jgi:peptidoglycan/LPS O-acetylase OafA/YrhL